MVRIYKLTKKNDSSEVINSTKTKKYSLLDNRKYKQNINNLIQKENKRKNISQYGGVTSGTPNFAERKPFTIFNTKRASRNAKTKYTVDKFDVYSKSQYFWLKRNIYNTIRGSWWLKLVGRITEEEHELLKRLLKSHMYFARIKLVMAKIHVIIEKLYSTNDSLIRTLQRKIRKIYDLQMDIEYAYKNPNEAQSKKIGITRRVINFFKNKKKTYEQFIKKIIEEQDVLRKEIMDQTIFTSTKDLGSKCNYLSKSFIAIKEKLNFSFRKSKKLICTLGRYRKYEAKFNKYYYLFREQYKKFIRAYPNCDNTVDTLVFDSYLNIDEENERKTGIDEYYKFDKTKCDSYNLKLKMTDHMTNAAALIKKQLEQGKGKKDKKSESDTEKEKLIDESFNRKAGDFTALMEKFKEYINTFKEIFRMGEAYGVRHHHGLPRKKGFLKSLLGISEKEVFAKKGRLEELQRDPVFVKEFTNMIKGFGEDVKSMFQPDDTDKALSKSIIPYIQLYDSYKYCLEDEDDLSACNGDCKVKDKFSVFSVNLQNIKDELYNSSYFYDLFQDSTSSSEKHGAHNLPVVVCVQNGYVPVGKNAYNHTNFEKGFLKNQYVSVAYSYAYNGSQTIDDKSYNIVYVRRQCIDEDYNRADDIIPIDQTNYFSLKNIPNGKGITLEKIGKSFAAVNFGFSSVKSSKTYEFYDLGSGSEVTEKDVAREKRAKIGDIKKTATYDLQQEYENNYKKNYNLSTLTVTDIRTLKDNYKKFKDYMSDPEKILWSDKIRDLENQKKIEDEKAAALAATAAAKTIKDAAATAAEKQRLAALAKGTGTGTVNPGTTTNPSTVNPAAIAATEVLALSKAKTEAENKMIEINKNILEIENYRQTTDIPNFKNDYKSYQTISDSKNTKLINNSINNAIQISEFTQINKNITELETEVNKVLIKIKSLKASSASGTPISIVKSEADTIKEINTYIDNLKTEFKILKIANNILTTDKQKFFKEKILSLLNNEISIEKHKQFIKDYDSIKSEKKEKYKTLYGYANEIVKDNLEVNINCYKTLENFKECITKLEKRINFNLLYEQQKTDFEKEDKIITITNSSDNTNLQNFITILKTINLDNIDISDFSQKENNIKLFTAFSLIYNIKDNDVVITKIKNSGLEKKYNEFIMFNKYENLEELKDTIKLINEIKDTPPSAGGGSFTPSYTPTPPVFTLVTTDLIGSRVEDLLHMDVINSFKLRSKQISEMFQVVKEYNGGREPDIICGDFGGSVVPIDDITMSNLVKLYIDKINPIRTPTTLEDSLKTFYEDGMELLLNNSSAFPNLSKQSDTIYPADTTTDSYPNEYKYTNNKTHLISNYVFCNNNNTATTFQENLPNKETKPNEIFDKFGDILPISVEFNASGLLQDLRQQTSYTQVKGRKYENVKLYSKEEMSKIISMIDKLMSQFTYGYKAYLKRDLGCFNFDSIENSNSSYSIRVKSKDDNPQLVDFYTMNYPAFIDVFLYQLGGFYNKQSSGEKVYYSENQLSRVSKFTASNTINFLNIKKIKDQNELIKHTIIRILLIPSDELHKISSVDTSVKVSDKRAGIDFRVVRAKDYMKQAKLFSHNFYLKQAIPNLEKRIKYLLDPSNTGVSKSTDDTYGRFREQSMADFENNILNRGLLYDLIKTKEKSIDKSYNGNNNINNKENETGKYDTSSYNNGKQTILVNIIKPNLISNLFEFIFIMLKLKFIEKEIYNIDLAVLTEEAPTVESEKFAIKGEDYKNIANAVFELYKLAIPIISGKIAAVSATGTGTSTDAAALKKENEIYNKIFGVLSVKKFISFDFTGKPIINNSAKIKKPDETKKISKVLDLKYIESYVAYELIIKIFKCIYSLPNKNDDYIVNLKSKLPTLITDDAVSGEKVKKDILLLIEKYLFINETNCASFSESSKRFAAAIIAADAAAKSTPPSAPGDSEYETLKNKKNELTARLTEVDNEIIDITKAKSLLNDTIDVLLNNIKICNNKAITHLTEAKKYEKDANGYKDNNTFSAKKTDFEALETEFQSIITNFVDQIKQLNALEKEVEALKTNITGNLKYFIEINKIVNSQSTGVDNKKLFENIIDKLKTYTDSKITDINLNKDNVDYLIANFEFGINNVDDATIKSKYKDLRRILVIYENEIVCKDVSVGGVGSICLSSSLTEIDISKGILKGGAGKLVSIVEEEESESEEEARKLKEETEEAKILEAKAKKLKTDKATKTTPSGKREIIFSDNTINGLLKEEKTNKSTKDNDVHILNFASMEKPGGEVENGFMGEEEELCRTCPDFYNALKEYHKGNTPINLLGKIVYTKPSVGKDYKSIITEQIRIIYNSLKSMKNFIFKTKALEDIQDISDVDFIRNDGCDDNAAYNQFPSLNNNKAKILSIFIPKLKDIEIDNTGNTITTVDTTGSIDEIKNFFNNEFDYKFNKLLNISKTNFEKGKDLSKTPPISILSTDTINNITPNINPIIVKIKAIIEKITDTITSTELNPILEELQKEFDNLFINLLNILKDVKDAKDAKDIESLITNIENMQKSVNISINVFIKNPISQNNSVNNILIKSSFSSFVEIIENLLSNNSTNATAALTGLNSLINSTLPNTSKTLIIGTGLFGKNFIENTGNLQPYTQFIIKKITKAFSEAGTDCEYNKILFAIPDKKNTKDYLKQNFYNAFNTNTTITSSFSISDDTKPVKTSSTGKSTSTVATQAEINEFILAITHIINNNIIDIKQVEIVPKQIKAIKDYVIEDKPLSQKIIEALIDDKNDKKKYDISQNSQLMNLLIHYLNEIVCVKTNPLEKPKLTQVKIYANKFIVKEGDILDNLTENTIIVDAAGTAFKGTNYEGGGISGAIYKNCYIGNNQIFGTNHKFKGKTTEDVFFNEELKKENLTCGKDNNRTKIVGIIHAIGPNGSEDPNKKIDIFNASLIRTLKNLYTEVAKIMGDTKIISDPSKTIDLRIPLISSGIYAHDTYKLKNDKGKLIYSNGNLVNNSNVTPTQDYFDFYLDEINKIFGKKIPNVNVTVYILGDPVNMYNQFMNSYPKDNVIEDLEDFCKPIVLTDLGKDIAKNKDEDKTKSKLLDDAKTFNEKKTEVEVDVFYGTTTDAIIHYNNLKEKHVIYTINSLKNINLLIDNSVIGNFVENGLEGDNEDLMRSSPQLYNSLKNNTDISTKLSDNDNDIYIVNNTSLISNEIDKKIFLINDINILRNSNGSQISGNFPKVNVFNVYDIDYNFPDLITNVFDKILEDTKDSADVKSDPSIAPLKTSKPTIVLIIKLYNINNNILDCINNIKLEKYKSIKLCFVFDKEIQDKIKDDEIIITKDNNALENLTVKINTIFKTQITAYNKIIDTANSASTETNANKKFEQTILSLLEKPKQIETYSNAFLQNTSIFLYILLYLSATINKINPLSSSAVGSIITKGGFRNIKQINNNMTTLQTYPTLPTHPNIRNSKSKKQQTHTLSKKQIGKNTKRSKILQKKKLTHKK